MINPRSTTTPGDDRKVLARRGPPKVAGDPKRRSAAKPADRFSPVQRVHPRPATKLRLFTYAAGRCQFRGCPAFLLEHPVTKKAGVFADMAHVVAYDDDGPRGKEERPIDINAIENLMLLCRPCHKLVDDNPNVYPVDRLREFKRSHEERMHYLTSLMPELQTTLVVFKALVGSQTVDVSFDEMAAAVAPRYPIDRRAEVIDLTKVSGDGSDYYQTACHQIDQATERLYAARAHGSGPIHLSLFALAPIPLLVHLGSRLTDKIPLELYQRHRDTEDWRWKDAAAAIGFRTSRRREGRDGSKVGLVLSLSGTIDQDRLPASIGSDFSVYELTLADATPSPLFLTTRDALTAFRVAYQQALREIERQHDGLAELHLFPAVPAPIAVLCGRERSAKTDPDLLVYDNDRRNGGFRLALRVRSR